MSAQGIEECIGCLTGTTERLESLRLGPGERGAPHLEAVLVSVGERKAFDGFDTCLEVPPGEEEANLHDVGDERLLQHRAKFCDHGGRLVKLAESKMDIEDRP